MVSIVEKRHDVWPARPIPWHAWLVVRYGPLTRHVSPVDSQPERTVLTLMETPMRDEINAPMLQHLQQLRKQSVYVASLCDAMLLGGATDRHGAMPLLPDALHVLHARVCEAIEAMEAHEPVRG